jgi:hypothetical protein
MAFDGRAPGQRFCRVVRVFKLRADVIPQGLREVLVGVVELADQVRALVKSEDLRGTLAGPQLVC